MLIIDKVLHRSSWILKIVHCKTTTSPSKICHPKVLWETRVLQWFHLKHKNMILRYWKQGNKSPLKLSNFPGHCSVCSILVQKTKFNHWQLFPMLVPLCSDVNHYESLVNTVFEVSHLSKFFQTQNKVSALNKNNCRNLNFIFLQIRGDLCLYRD